MLGKFLNKNKTQDKPLLGEIVLLIDITSSSVGAGVIKNFKGKGKAPLIFKTCRNNIYFTEKIQPRDFIDKSKLNIKKTLEELLYSDNTFGKIDKVRVFYGSPWYKSYIKNMDKTEKGLKEFDVSYLKNITRQHREIESDTEIETLEKKIISIKINGYRTKNPLGKKFKNVSVSFYESAIHSETQNELLEIISDFVKTDDIKFNTRPLSVLRVLEEKFENKESYTIIDMSGEITEITVVRDGSFDKIISIPRGSSYIIRELAKKFNQDFMNSISKINLLLNGELDELNESKYIDSFNEIKREWLEAVRQLTTDNKIDSLPVDVFLLVDKECKKIAIELLNDVEGYSSSFMFGRKPNIHLMDSDSIINLVRYMESAKKDPLITMAAGFIEATE